VIRLCSCNGLTHFGATEHLLGLKHSGGIPFETPRITFGLGPPLVPATIFDRVIALKYSGKPILSFGQQFINCKF